MKPLARSRRWIGALRAEFREERLGARTVSHDRPFPGRTGARIAEAPSAPRAPPAAQNAASDFATPLRRLHEVAPRKEPHANTFSLGILTPRRLSGSVQWQCICNGSGDVQRLNPASKPNPLQIHR